MVEDIEASLTAAFPASPITLKQQVRQGHRAPRAQKDAHDKPLEEANNRVDNCKKVDDMSY